MVCSYIDFTGELCTGVQIFGKLPKSPEIWAFWTIFTFSCYLIQIVFCREQCNKIPHWNLPPPDDSSNIVWGSKHSTLHGDFKGCSFQTLCALFPQEHPQWGVSEKNIQCRFPGVSKAITDPFFSRFSILPTEIFCFLLIEKLIHLLFRTLIFSFSSEWIPWGILIYHTACLIILF